MSFALFALLAVLMVVVVVLLLLLAGNPCSSPRVSPYESTTGATNYERVVVCVARRREAL
jgi:NADH:ubiquinone oxidoreductase subunit 3 (subunit A)